MPLYPHIYIYLRPGVSHSLHTRVYCFITWSVSKIISIAAKIANVCLYFLCFLFCTFYFFCHLNFPKTSLWFHGCLPTFWEVCVLKLFFRDPRTKNTAPSKKILSKDGIILLCKNKLELIEATLFISHGPVLWLTHRENPQHYTTKKKKKKKKEKKELLSNELEYNPHLPVVSHSDFRNLGLFTSGE